MGGDFLLSVGIAQGVFMEASPLPVKAAKTLAFQRMNYSKSYSYGGTQKTNDRPTEGTLRAPDEHEEGEYHISRRKTPVFVLIKNTGARMSEKGLAPGRWYDGCRAHRIALYARPAFHVRGHIINILTTVGRSAWQGSFPSKVGQLERPKYVGVR